MKNRFAYGIVVGVLISLMVLTVGVTAFIVMNPGALTYLKIYTDPNYAYLYQNGADSSKDETGTEAVTAEETLLEKVFTGTYSMKLQRVLNIVENNYIDDITAGAVQDGIINGIMSSLDDKYADYYTDKEYKEMLEGIGGIYGGIGAYVSFDYDYELCYIVEPFEDSPAIRAGMQPGDYIAEIDGEDMTGFSLDEVVAKMKGTPETTVVVGVYRASDPDIINLTITREIISSPTIKYKMRDNNIGYIRIEEFDTITCEQFEKAIDELESKGMEGLIIDLRSNGGGLFDSCVAMLDRMIPEGRLVYTEDKDGNIEEYFAQDDTSFDKPVVVLVNAYTASASEIFTGAMKDNNRATVVGTKTFGKGIVQITYPLFVDNSAVKLTVERYYTPSGVCIHGEGIEPDEEVLLDEEYFYTSISLRETDNQIERAEEILLEQAAGSSK